MPEAKLAREAEICYATVTMVTDFDCWHPDQDAVTVQDIIRVLTANAEKAIRLVARDFAREHEPSPTGSDRTLDNAIITAPEARDPELFQGLDAVAGRMLNKSRGARSEWWFRHPRCAGKDIIISTTEARHQQASPIMDRAIVGSPAIELIDSLQ